MCSANVMSEPSFLPFYRQKLSAIVFASVIYQQKQHCSSIIDNIYSQANERATVPVSFALPCLFPFFQTLFVISVYSNQKKKYRHRHRRRRRRKRRRRKTEIETEIKIETETETESDTDTDTESETETEAVTETESETETEAKTLHCE